MIDLPNVSLVCADTTRSRAYLQNLSRAGFRPAKVLVLAKPQADLPGQSRTILVERPLNAENDPLWQTAHFDPNSSLLEDITANGAPFNVLDLTDINHPDVVAGVAALPGDTVLYSGFGGQILRAAILAAGKQFLHVHGGYLPDFRGSTTNYYSMIEEAAIGASAIFLTAEIDAGPVLMRRRFPVPPDRTQIDHLHDSAARATVLCEVLQVYNRTGNWPDAEVATTETARTFYVIHPVLKHIAVFREPAKRNRQ